MIADAFNNRKNFFAKRNVTAVVIEVPSHFIGEGLVRGWATASLYGHAPEIQVSRWGLPLVTNVFMPDAETKEQFNRATPADVRPVSSGRSVASRKSLPHWPDRRSVRLTTPKQLTARLFPTMLPYELGTPAAFDFAGFNGRSSD